MSRKTNMGPGDVVASLKRRIADMEGREIHLQVPPEHLNNVLEAPEGLQNAGTQGIAGVTGPLPLSGGLPLPGGLPRWHLGLGAVDRMLPNGALVHAGLHEVVAASHGDGPAASGFAVALAVRLLHSLSRSNRGLILWCARGRETREFGRLYGPGLMAMGLNPANLLVAAAERSEDLLWAMEEGVKTPALAGVVGEVGAVGLTATRRLQLAARASGVPAVILRSARDARPSAARTQWRVSAAAPVFTGLEVIASTSASTLASTSAVTADSENPDLARPRWQVTLERCRGPVSGAWPRTWDLEWNHETHRFHMAATLAGRSAADAPGDQDGQDRQDKIVSLRRAGQFRQVG